MKLNEIIPNWKADGVITRLARHDDIAFLSDADTARLLNLQYHGNHSGSKTIAPLVYAFTDDNETLPDADFTMLTDVIATAFTDKWNRLFAAFNAEYNPLENYDMTENETVSDDTVSNGSQIVTDSTSTNHTGTQTIGVTGTETHTGTQTLASTNETAHTGTDGTESEKRTNGTEGVNNRIVGFNSISEGVPSGGSTTTHADTETNNATRTLNLSDESTENNTRTDNLTDGKSETTTRTDDLHDTGTLSRRGTTEGRNEKDISRELTRHGNIGVTTSQQMLLSEIEVRKWNFYNSVFEDIDTILCLPIY